MTHFFVGFVVGYIVALVIDGMLDSYRQRFARRYMDERAAKGGEGGTCTIYGTGSVASSPRRDRRKMK